MVLLKLSDDLLAFLKLSASEADVFTRAHVPPVRGGQGSDEEELDKGIRRPTVSPWTPGSPGRGDGDLTG